MNSWDHGRKISFGWFEIMVADWLTITIGFASPIATLIACSVSLYAARSEKSSAITERVQPRFENGTKNPLWMRVLSPFVVSPIVITYNVYWLTDLIRFGHPSTWTSFDISLSVGSIVLNLLAMVITSIDEKLRQLSKLGIETTKALEALEKSQQMQVKLMAASLETDQGHSDLIGALVKTQEDTLRILEQSNLGDPITSVRKSLQPKRHKPKKL